MKEKQRILLNGLNCVRWWNGSFGFN